jgi:anti-sigma B factor antagonist
MKLLCQSQKIGDVVVIRCEGRIVVGEEVRALQLEVEKFRLETKKFVLQLEAVAYIDSGGLGAVVRLLGTLRAARGDLKLCQLSPFLLQVFEATNLKSIFHTYGTEAGAVAAFSQRRSDPLQHPPTSRPKVICIDSSSDLLAYLSALLKRCDYEVYTAKFLMDAATLVKTMRPSLAICGPTTQASTAAFEKFRHADPEMQIFLLPSDFHATDAGQAGLDLVAQVRSLLNA